MIERNDPVNWSTLKYISNAHGGSPKHYRHILANPREDTEALLLGRVTHCAVYEPESLADRYVVMPRFHGGQKDATAIKNGYEGGREAKAAWMAEIRSPGYTVVPAELYGHAIGMRDALLADPIAKPLMENGEAEQLVTWTDEQTGIECRGRVDHSNGRLSDLKSAHTIVPRRFFADVAKYGYHGQLAFYEDGLKANGAEFDGPPVIIAVESKPPYDVMVVQLSEEDLAAGRRVYRQCLDRLTECRSGDEWPGVADLNAVPLELPAWAAPQSVMDSWKTD